MENFEQLCQNRRSIRRYTAKPIEQEKMEYILRCALMSPSGKRVNPWEFVVIRRESILRELATCRTAGSGMFATATAAIAVVLDPALTDVWMCDGSIAAQNILLAAEDCGLGACWCMIFGREDAEQKVRSLTGIPEDKRVLCVISLGYKDEERKPYDSNKLLYQKIHNETY